MTGLNKIYSIDELRSALKPIFAQYPIYSAILFGSYARGEATEQSDIDIVIDSHRELLDIRFYGVLEDITEKLAKPIDLFEACGIQNPSPIYSIIEKEGVSLYDAQG
jgi:predicted nucleotidyltransferase